VHECECVRVCVTSLSNSECVARRHTSLMRPTFFFRSSPHPSYTHLTTTPVPKKVKVLAKGDLGFVSSLPAEGGGAPELASKVACRLTTVPCRDTVACRETGRRLEPDEPVLRWLCCRWLCCRARWPGRGTGSSSPPHKHAQGFSRKSSRPTLSSQPWKVLALEMVCVAAAEAGASMGMTMIYHFFSPSDEK